MGRINQEEDPPKSLHGKVFEQLQNDILSGKYKPGDCLNEVRLTKEMGVSRTPIREAFRQLELDGLIAYMPNRGVVVRGLSEEDIRDIYQIRLMIEGMTARRAAENITEDQISEMREIIELEEFYTNKGDAGQLSKLDSRFHETMYKASGSRLLTKTLKEFHHYIVNIRNQSLSDMARAKKSYEEHKVIFEAISARDRELAEILMEQHIRNATGYIEKNNRLRENQT